MSVPGARAQAEVRSSAGDTTHYLEQPTTITCYPASSVRTSTSIVQPGAINLADNQDSVPQTVYLLSNSAHFSVQ